MSASGGTQGRIGRAIELVLVVAASLVFVLLWVYVALDVLTDSTVPADTWTWLSGLDLIGAIVVWIAILPVGVYLWAAQADLDQLWLGLVMLGLVAWTWIAWSGLVRVLWRRATAAS
jgi:hypothetical protein